MAECPQCGYVLQPFERTCPKCIRAATRRTAPARRRRGQQTGRDRRLYWAVAAVVVAIAILAAVWRSLPKPASPFGGGGSLVGSVPATGLSEAEPVPESQSAPEMTSSAGVGYAAPSGPSPEEIARREAARQSPFRLAVGQQVSARSSAASSEQVVNEVQGSGRGGLVDGIAIGEWALQGLGGQPLRVSVQPGGEAQNGDSGPAQYWMDQPFELLRNGQLVGTFQSTADYTQAQQ